MVDRSAFQIQIMEKLGVPLINAVESAAQREGDDAGISKQSAEVMASLVAKAVQVSIALADIMEIKDNDMASDSSRLALSGLAAPLIANFYTLNGKAPDDAAVKNIVKAMGAALTFSDNFAPVAENTLRMQLLDPSSAVNETAGADELQINMQYLHALLPAINAVAEFSFGQAEIKLVQDISSRLIGYAKTICKVSSPSGSDDSAPAQRRAELLVLGPLADLYAVSHQNEMAKYMAMDEKARDAADSMSMDSVWEAFELRAGMMEALGKGMQSSAPASVPVAAPPPVAQETVQVEAPVQPLPEEEVSLPSAPPVSEVVAAEIPPAPQEDDAPYNPMSFFKPGEKPAEGSEGKNQEEEK